MKKSLIVNSQTILILNKKVVWLKKNWGATFHSKNIQAEKSNGNGSDMGKFAKETDIKNSHGHELIKKANALESFEKLIVSV